MESWEQDATTEHTVATQTHGRYLVSPGTDRPGRLLIGFHGYGESAEDQLRRLRAIPGADPWTVASIQGLHQFYRRRTNEVVASWMTRQNRELAIEDNVAYVLQVIRRIEGDAAKGIVVAGFSQGVAMAYRVAVILDRPDVGLIACCGDVPPELDNSALSRIPAVLIGRGARDDWYTAEKMGRDEERLRRANVQVESITFDAAHEWSTEFSNACLGFIRTHLQET
ncbi:MAG TPA: phospholipase [Terriglobia bacterium]|nr:phospholipase [Terriglobia bacterium]